MSDTSGEDWLVERLADVGKAWKEDVARLTSRIAELERAAETLTEQRSRAEIAAEDARRMADEYIAEAERAAETTRAEHAAARAEVEQLRGKLADAVDAGERLFEGTMSARRDATARVRSMREACAAAVRGWGTIYSGTEQLVQDIANEVEALPLDTGTATDTGGEVRDRIHAAIRSADEKGCCNLPACAFRPDGTCTILCDELVAAFQREPQADAFEAAPGTVTPAKGTP